VFLAFECLSNMPNSHFHLGFYSALWRLNNLDESGGRSTHTPNLFPQRRQSDAERNGAKFQFSIKPVPNENENISPRRPPGTLGRVSRTKFDPNNPNPLRSEVVPNFVSRPRSFLIHQFFVFTQTPDRPRMGQLLVYTYMLLAAC
jgi:hypothetical protein